MFEEFTRFVFGGMFRTTCFYDKFQIYLAKKSEKKVF